VFTKLDCFLEPLCAKGLGAGQQMNCFHPIRLTLPIITVDDIEARSPLNLSTEVPEISRFNCSEQHSGILTQMRMGITTYL
jgi:hypothetical protein